VTLVIHTLPPKLAMKTKADSKAKKPQVKVRDLKPRSNPTGGAKPSVSEIQITKVVDKTSP